MRLLLCSMILASAIAAQARPVYEAQRTYGNGFEVTRIDTFAPLELLSANGIARIDAQNLAQWQVTEPQAVETIDLDGNPITITQDVVLAWAMCAWDDSAPLPRKATDAELADRVAAAQAIATAQAEAEAVSEAERRNTPIIYDQPIEMPALILQAKIDRPMGVGVVAYVDEDGLNLVPYEAHSSPMPDHIITKQRQADAIDAHKDAKRAAKIEKAAMKADIAAGKDEIEKIKRKPK